LCTVLCFWRLSSAGVKFSSRSAPRPIFPRSVLFPVLDVPLTCPLVSFLCLLVLIPSPCRRVCRRLFCFSFTFLSPGAQSPLALSFFPLTSIYLGFGTFRGSFPPPPIILAFPALFFLFLSHPPFPSGWQNVAPFEDTRCPPTSMAHSKVVYSAPLINPSSSPSSFLSASSPPPDPLLLIWADEGFVPLSGRSSCSSATIIGAVSVFLLAIPLFFLGAANDFFWVLFQREKVDYFFE